MDPLLFQQRLAELAELRPIRPPVGPAAREAVVPEQIVRHGKTFSIDRKHNPSWLYEVKKLKLQDKACEHCDRTVLNQIISIRYLGYPEPHRRESCSVCHKTRNPESGEFDLSQIQANNFFVMHFRKKNK